MKILHLSDLHLTGPNKTLRQVWIGPRGALNEHHHEQVDFIVVSGDLSQQASTHEYDALRTFTEESLLPLLGDHRDDRRRVVFVPGNHDVAWSGDPVAEPWGFYENIRSASDADDLAEVLAKAARPHEYDYRTAVSRLGHLEVFRLRNPAAYSRRMANVQTFLDGFYGASARDPARHFDKHFDLLADPAVGADWSCHVFHQENVAFFGFNSCHRNDRYWQGALFNPEALSAAQAHATRLRVAHPNMVIFAVWHHGFTSDRTRPDRLTLEELGLLYGAGFRIGLHGHTHKSSAKVVDDLFRDRFVILSTGSLGACAADRPGAVGNQFSMLYLQGSLQLTAELFQGDDDSRNFKSVETRRFDLRNSAPARWKASSGAESHAVRHERTWTADGSGIARVAVDLAGFTTHDQVPLAVLSVPFSNVLAATMARVGALRLRVHEDRSSPRRARYILEQTHVENADLSWSYVVSNAVALHQAELALLPHRDNWVRELGTGEEAGAGVAWDSCRHMVRIPCDQLVLRLRFLPATQTRIDACQPAVHRRDETAAGETWREVPEESLRCRVAVDTARTEATLVVDTPVPGCRYSLVYKPLSALVPPPQPLPEWAATVAEVVVRECRGRVADRGSAASVLTAAVETAVAGFLEDQLTIKSSPPGEAPWLGERVVWVGHFWDRKRRRLMPSFGRFPPPWWGEEFDAGSGVVGHAFRFARHAAWVQGVGGAEESCIEAPRAEGSEVHYDWILCVPITIDRAFGPAVGVVGFAGSEPSGAVAKRLQRAAQYICTAPRRDLGDTGANGERAGLVNNPDERFLTNLSDALNNAFWEVVTTAGELFDPEDRAHAHQVLKPHTEGRSPGRPTGRPRRGR